MRCPTVDGKKRNMTTESQRNHRNTCDLYNEALHSKTSVTSIGMKGRKRQRDREVCNECSTAANQLSGLFPITSLSSATKNDHSGTTAAVNKGGVAMALLPINSAWVNQT